MNTQGKIVSSDEARLHLLATPEQWLVLRGAFDPVLASVVRQIEQAVRRVPGRKLLALVDNLPAAVLPGEARLRLVAALRIVDFVALADPRSVLPDDIVQHWIEEDSAAFKTAVQSRKGSRS